MFKHIFLGTTKFGWNKEIGGTLPQNSTPLLRACWTIQQNLTFCVGAATKG